MIFILTKRSATYLCKSFLIKDIRQKDQYEAAYERLTPFEKLRIAALVLEHKQDYKEANNYWRLCIDNIHEEANKSENEKHLAISLIFKRMAENEKHKGPSSSYDIDAWKTRMIEYLEASVKFDPYDRNPYDEIIKYYAYMDSTKETQAWIDTLVERFPEDIPALFMASNSAFERSAYKKALVFLDRIIQIDPVNKDAKAKKVFIHITKASKNIDEKKFHIARKEFEAAADCSKKNTYEYGGVLIKWGCMELLANNKQKGDDLVHEGFTLTGQGLRALFLTVVESKRMGLASSIYKKYNRLFQEQLALPVTEGKVIELIDTALPYMYTSYQDKKNDIKSVVNYLNKAVNFQFDKGNLLKICAYLKESASYRMLKTYAENGIKKWYDDGLFLYYFIWGKYEGKFHKVSDTDISKLEHAHKMAIDGQDAETVSKLDEIFDQIYKESHPFDKIGDIRIIKDMIERIKNEEGDNFLNFFDELFERTFFEGFNEEETDKKKKRFFPKDFF